MAKKKKLRKFTAVTVVKAMARAAVGQPPATRRDPDTKKKSEAKSVRHKKPLSKLLAEQE